MELNKLIESGLLYRTSNKLLDKIINNEELKCHLLRFCKDNILEYISTIDTIHNIKPKITLNSLKLSYKIYQTTKKLFVPIYYRTFYGYWQKSSGACSGLFYEYNQKETCNLANYEYMCFEKVSDMIKNDRKCFAKYDKNFNIGNLIWSEKC